jgi:UDP-galactopyranose mutase
LVESAPMLGGGVRTMWYGGHPHTFGPRHFLTPHEHIFEFLNKYVPLRKCPEHQALTYVERDGAFYNFPIHKDDIARMPDADKIRRELNECPGPADAVNLEEFWIKSIGWTLYDKFINSYNKKMWLMDDNKALDTFEWSPKGPTLKEGPRAFWDTRISAYPYAANGYDDYFPIATKEAKVRLSTKIDSYDIPRKTVWIEGEKLSFDVVINTISPDMLFERAYGELPFVGVDFHKIVLPVEHSFPENVYFLYYANNECFKRLVEYKKFTRHQSPTTLIGMEVPSMNGKYYPIPVKAELAKAKKYFDEMPDGVFSIGRAGSYQYYVDVDDCIAQAMDVAAKLR